MKRVKVAVVGATGLVGEYILKLLEERKFPVSELRLYASEKSSGKKISWKRRKLTVENIEDIKDFSPHLTFFATSSEVSKEYVPQLLGKGSFVIDKSRAFRMSKEVPLVVPEVNSKLMNKNTRLVASPNCTTIQLVMTIAPILKVYNITKLIATTMQSVSGAGKKALDELQSGKAELDIVPVIGEIVNHGYCEEERAIYCETRKILQRMIRMAVTTVRVPVEHSHSISLWLKLLGRIEIGKLINSFNSFPGVKFMREEIPTNKMAAGKDEVFIARLRKDPRDPRAILLYSVCDNLRKGAATNALQIAETALKKELLR